MLVDNYNLIANSYIDILKGAKTLNTRANEEKQLVDSTRYKNSLNKNDSR